MSMPPTAFDAEKFLSEHPDFAHVVTQFMALRDAADVLAEVKPPQGDTVAPYLRVIADSLMRDAGVPVDFVQAMIAGRPPLYSRLPPNVGPEAYPAPMATPAGTGSHSPFPVAPADVPVAAVRALTRTMLRHGQPVDEDLARLLVAMVIAALAQPSGDGAVPVTAEPA